MQNEFLVAESATMAGALSQLDGDGFDLILLDLSLPDGNGLDILDQFAGKYRDRIIVLTGTGSIETAVLSMKKGAHDFLQKPVNPEILLLTLNRAFNFLHAQDDCLHLKQEIGATAGFDKFICKSEQMAKVIAMAKQYADTAHTILISGETGTGKEIMAQAIHAGSKRRHQPLVSVNCASIPENLAESELFGYKKGAFTGAFCDSPGKFVQANHGTIFLDEIAELPLNIQAKLLRVLENGEVTPLQSRTPKFVDIRILAATNKVLEDEVKKQRFREDLFFRIDELKIHIPPLRTRPADIMPLAEHFLRIASIANSRPGGHFSGEAQRLLCAYDWPGNIRELKNTVAMIAASGGPAVIRPEHLPLKILNPEKTPALESREKSLATIEKNHIAAILQQTAHNYSKAAVVLGISRSSLYRKMADFHLEKK
ncbi:MAG: sigma-54 dependent transcriptional regulator [Candidatus Aminicenantes bacterium]|nr:sigma-54 dependent transcriptional regulator [Candidatus Aminicenantes bacterium]